MRQAYAVGGRCSEVSHHKAIRQSRFSRAAVAALVLMSSACGGGGSGGGASPATPPPPPPANTTNLSAALVAEQVIGGSGETGTASASLTLNRDDGSLTGRVTLNGVTATGVTINSGFAGERGAVIVTLSQDNATTWSVPAGAVLTADDRDALAAGAIYVSASSSAQPDGAVRGQLLTGSVSLLLVPLGGGQEVPLLTSAATAVAAVTLNRGTGAVVVHVNTAGLDDAVGAHVHQALAGVNGPVLITLEQDSNDPKHWASDGAVLDAAGLQALDAAQLYVNVHTPAHPNGEVRGQIVTANRVVLFVPLSGSAEVPPVVVNGASATAAITVDPQSRGIVVHVNSVGLDDAVAAHVHQAPIGANGPVVIGLDQDSADASHWQSNNVTLDSATFQALDAGELYVNVHTPAHPDGAVRGQIVLPDTTPTSGAFRVASVAPAAGANLTSFPSQLVVTFNRDVKPTTVTTTSVAIRASGGDGSFGDGNETSIAPVSITSNAATSTIDLSGVAVANDTFEIRLKGTGAELVTDANGNVLDGDSDNAAGGDFVSMYTVTAASTTTFTWIQNNVFTPSCAGCHGGATPAQGMNLSAGQAYAAIVNVASSEQPALLRVNPGNPDQSYLVQKIEGTAAVGSRMPLFLPPLSNEVTQAIRQWIANGAPND